MSNDNQCNYTKLTLVEHVLAKPSMYIGNVDHRSSQEYLVTQTNDQIEIELYEINYNEGLIKIFAEILSNTSDNWARSLTSPCKQTAITVTCDKQSGLTSVSNDGLGINFENKDSKTGLFIPEMIFGQLLTSSNFNADQERVGGGTYGIGAKATNVFSTMFEIQIDNQTLQKQYIQKWTGNMKQCSLPRISSSKIKKNCVKVSWTPDFKRFGCENYSEDHIRLMFKMAVDLAMITGNVVTFNGFAINLKSLDGYANLYKNPSKEKLLICDQTNNTEVVVCPNAEFEAITFVNGIMLKQGIHIKLWIDCIFKPLMDMLNASAKQSSSKNLLNIKETQNKFKLFIKMNLKNPEYANANKSSLIGPALRAPVISKNVFRELLTWSVVEDLKSLLLFKSAAGLRKLEKDVKHVKINGYEAANFSRTKRSQECSLLLCEGASAKTFCVAGVANSSCLGKMGRDFFGILPQKGKGLNVLNAPVKQIQENQEIKNLIQVLGLKHNVDYTLAENRKTLHYGNIILMTDSDCDGSHISGLIMTFFNTLYPSLVQTQDFIFKMQTPIITVKQSEKCIYKFYNLFEARKYIKEHNPPSKTVSYLKGLGSCSEKLAKDIFGKRMSQFTTDWQTQDLIHKAFHKNYPDVRKAWLQAYAKNDSDQTPESGQVLTDLECKEAKLQTDCISDFIKKEMVEFSIMDCRRTIPSVFDGLKESQRKILFTCFQKNLSHKSPGIKTSQLAGAVAELTNFKYGEDSLHDTIYRMGHNFVGSNNINLLDPNLSQFGSRLENGKDAPAARYTKTRLGKLTHLIFRKEDFDVLQYVNDEGQDLEPEWYVPIVPMILINGCNGIGMGFSSTVPNYNPLEIIDMLKSKLTSVNPVSRIEPIPWYRGFEGSIFQCSENKFEVQGKITNIAVDKYKITEIPISKPISKFDQELQALVHDGTIKRVVNHCSGQKIDYTAVCQKDGFIPSLKNLKLIEYVHTSNMVLFGKADKLAKYDFFQIFDAFFEERLDTYKKRLQLTKLHLEQQLLLVQQKHQFVKSVVENQILIYHRSKSQIIDQIKEMKIQDVKNNQFHNLLSSIPIVAFSTDQVADLSEELLRIKQSLVEHLRIDATEVWIQELNELVDALQNFKTSD